MGKGSKERSRCISYEEYSRRWTAAFSKKEEEEEEQEEEEACPCGRDECCE